jgi:hypothetical protein
MSDERAFPICTSLSELTYTSDLLLVTCSKATDDIRTENVYEEIGPARYWKACKVTISWRELTFSSLGGSLHWKHSVVVFTDHFLSHNRKSTFTFDAYKPHKAGRTYGPVYLWWKGRSCSDLQYSIRSSHWYC